MAAWLHGDGGGGSGGGDTDCLGQALVAQWAVRSGPAPDHHAAMQPARAHLAAHALLSTVWLVYAGSPHFDSTSTGLSHYNDQDSKVIDTAAASAAQGPRGCVHEGRWFALGAAVAAREACLRCVCGRGALVCGRRSCAPLPEPPPSRCHVLHAKGACCPELHCPDGVRLMELGASASSELDDLPVVSSSAASQACVEGGTVYAAGSAMGSRTACEQCFCLGGRRRCVRPRCLPPPAGCAPRPAPGACCPQRYYCQHAVPTPPDHSTTHDCVVGGVRVAEGERAERADGAGACAQCFCLRGAVRCQPLACAPPLLGCRPLLRPGQCCAHQYQCDHSAPGGEEKLKNVDTLNELLTHNALISVRNEDRSFYKSKTIRQKPEIKSILQPSTESKVSTTSASKESLIPTAKVKRKASETTPTHFNSKIEESSTTPKSLSVSFNPTTVTEKMVSDKISTIETSTSSDLEVGAERSSTEQPEESVKIVINGTINCTAELSSTSIPLNETKNSNEHIYLDSYPRTPNIKDRMDIEAQTFDPSDIITDKSVNGEFDDGETFTINVTSSLRTNTSHSSSLPGKVASKPGVVTDIKSVNTSKKDKEDYDYDYNEPTLPPSLPNLKIIPFVAADAVVDEDTSPSAKEDLAYPILEREDKFPVYYPTVEKETSFATRSKDIYHRTQYPVFSSEKEDQQFSSMVREADVPESQYPSAHNDVGSAHEYAASAAMGGHHDDHSEVTKAPSSTGFRVEAPAVNLFSPPVETEGGFVPKGPSLIDEYYSAFPSTPPAPRLTTSMQLDTHKEVAGECVTGDGRRVPPGATLPVACSLCACSWGALHCAPRPCPAPPGCRRRPPSGDLCCGTLVCEQETIVKLTTKTPRTTTEKNQNESHTTSQEQQHVSKTSTVATVQTTHKTHEGDYSTLLFNEFSSTTQAKQETTLSTETTTGEVRESTDTPATLTTTSESPTSAESAASTAASTTPVTTTTALPPNYYKDTINETSQEYEEEEEEDEGFSFGSVLKLLLSDSYDTTTNTPVKKSTATIMPKVEFSATSTTSTTQKSPNTTRRYELYSKPSIVPFVPMPHHYQPYAPPKNTFLPVSVNKIDHLVLGEATAIRKTTTRPIIPHNITPTPFKPVPTSQPVTKRPTSTTQLPEVTQRTRLPEVTKERVTTGQWYTSIKHETPKPTEPSTRKPLPPTTIPDVTNEVLGSDQYTSVSHDGASRPASAGVGSGLLKLAGCNIYGRMYRVGRIIAELSSACQECRCTEFGVQCKDLKC